MIFDVLIIGGGHAGLEAAWIAASFDRLNVALVTFPGVPIGSTPCNPAIGGVGKGQVVRELDALGGLMGRLADEAGIQYRILNESKGYAVQSTRVQVDKDLYAQAAARAVASSRIRLIEAEVVQIRVNTEGEFILALRDGQSLTTKKLIVTTGTFLNGKLHSGANITSGGRFQSLSSQGMSDLISMVRTNKKRFKTGTPPRLKLDSVNFDVCEEQESDPAALNFHFNHQDQRLQRQISCYLTRILKPSLDIIRENKEKSPMYNGQITGVGPRYCPSIEDKAFRYPDRHDHHVFLEPEGLYSGSVYPNGISTSLPLDVQKAFIRQIPGLEEAEILIPGYAVEYDVVDTSCLDQVLMYREIDGLYFAGQVNGTSGYEEAAAQGFVAGVNAAHAILNKEKIVFSREDSYIGVLVEDLVTSSRDEPYRLFTARSENRLYLREDNSILRMNNYCLDMGLNRQVDRYNKQFIYEFQLLTELARDFRYKSAVEFPDLAGSFIGPQTMEEVICRGNVDPVSVLQAECRRYGVKVPLSVVRCAAISLKYAGYITRSDNELLRLNKVSNKRIQWRELMNYSNISFECKQRIELIKPETFHQLQKIEGIRPATLVFVAGTFS
jgi:tRNA uridine 5-carboxymethylaminomethyl modification enzyme